MELQKFLSEVTQLPGLPGYESQVAEYLSSAFVPYCDDVTVDAMGSVWAKIGQTGPRILICAHQDEIGLIVTKIEKDGCLRFHRMGGVDPRILPSLEVTVHTQSGPLFGVVGAKPPHLLTEEDRKKALKMTDLYIDVGLSPENATKTVRVGDTITMSGPTIKLDGNRLASKTMDDRAGVAVMLECAKILSTLKFNAQVFLVSSIQEEVGSRGAKTSAFAIDPDLAVAIDVTHGEGPGTGKYEAHSLDTVVTTIGPTIHPVLHKLMMDTAKNIKINIKESVSSGETWTDADVMQISRCGVPTGLIEIPLKYMHTTVETLSLDVVKDAGRLLAHFIQDVSTGWEGIEWY